MLFDLGLGAFLLGEKRLGVAQRGRLLGCTDSRSRVSGRLSIILVAPVDALIPASICFDRRRSVALRQGVGGRSGLQRRASQPIRGSNNVGRS